MCQRHIIRHSMAHVNTSKQFKMLEDMHLYNLHTHTCLRTLWKTLPVNWKWKHRKRNQMGTAGQIQIELTSWGFADRTLFCTCMPPKYRFLIPESGREWFFREKRCLSRLCSNTAESFAEVSAEVMAVFKDCQQTLPKVLRKWWLFWKTVFKHCPKFCWSDGYLERLSSNTAQSSAEVMAILKDCLQRLSSNIAESSAEVMAVFKDCHQRLPKVLLKTLPKVLLKWWLSLKTVFKHCPKFCWSDGCL